MMENQPAKRGALYKDPASGVRREKASSVQRSKTCRRALGVNWTAVGETWTVQTIYPKGNAAEAVDIG